MGQAERADKRRRKRELAESKRYDAAEVKRKEAISREASARIDDLARQAIAILKANDWRGGRRVDLRKQGLFSPSSLMGWRVCDMQKGHRKAVAYVPLYLLSDGRFAGAGDAPRTSFEYLRGHASPIVIHDMEYGVADLIRRLRTE